MRPRQRFTIREGLSSEPESLSFVSIRRRISDSVSATISDIRPVQLPVRPIQRHQRPLGNDEAVARAIACPVVVLEHPLLKLDEPRPGYSQLQPEDLPPFMRDDRTAAFGRRSLTQLSGIEEFQVQQHARRNSSRTTSCRSTPATEDRTASRRVRRTGPLLRGRPSRGRTGWHGRPCPR